MRRAHWVLSPNIGSPVTAEGQVEDEVVVLEMLVDLAFTFKSRSWLAPSTWVRVAAREVVGHCASWEEPDADGFACPFCRINSTTIRIEPAAVRCRIVGSDLTPCIWILTRGVDVAVERRHVPSEGAGVADVAPSTGVKGHVVSRLRVDTFYYIYLASGGPLGTQCPTVEIISHLVP